MPKETRLSESVFSVSSKNWNKTKLYLSKLFFFGNNLFLIIVYYIFFFVCLPFLFNFYFLLSVFGLVW